MRKLIIIAALMHASTAAANCGNCTYASTVEQRMHYAVCSELAGDAAEHARHDPELRLHSERYDDRRLRAQVIVHTAQGQPAYEIRCERGRMISTEHRPGQ